MDTIDLKRHPHIDINKLHKIKGTRITPEILDAMRIPVGGGGVIYDRASQKAFFYKRNEKRHKKVLTVDKRSRKITCSADDIIATLAPDGIMCIGDPYEVFEVLPATKK